MSIKQKILKGTFWNFVGNVSNQFITLVVMFFLARQLGSKDYGKYALIYSTILTASNLAGAGLGTTATKFIAEYKYSRKEKDLLSQILGVSYLIANILSVFLTLSLYFFADRIAIDVFNDQSLISQLKSASIYVFFFTVNGFQIGMLIGFEKFNNIAVINIIKSLFHLLSAILLVNIYGLNGAAISLALTSIVTYSISTYLISKSMKEYNIIFKVKITREIFDKMINFTIPAALVGITTSFGIWYANQILVNKSSGGYIDMSVFNLASNLKNIIIFLPNVIIGVITPILINQKKMDYQKYRKVFNINCIGNGGLTLILGGLLTLFSPIIIALLGEDYTGLQAVLIIISFSSMFEIIASCLFQEIYVYNMIWLNFICAVIWSVILILTTCYFVDQQGPLAISMGYLFAYLFQSIVYLILILSNRKNSKEIKD